MKVLRVCLTYPHDNTPGIGLPCYYHSLFSSHEEMIVTRKVEGDKFPIREGVRLVEIESNNTGLGQISQSLLGKVISLLRKTTEQIDFLLKARPYIKAFQPEVVHIYTPMPILVGLWCRWKFGTKIVMSLHGTDVLRIKSSRIYSFCMESPDAVVTVGRTMQDEFKHLKLKRPITSIGNGVDIKTFFNKKNPRRHQFIQVASLRWQKGQNYLFDAFGKFYQNHKDYKLVMVGEGPDKGALLEQAQQGDFLDAVVFRGMLCREEVAQELNQSEAFVLSSVSEGFPKVIIEAMATGTPIISTDVGNVPEVVKDAGFIVPSKNIDALYEAMERIVSSDVDWKNMSNKCEQYANEYTWQSVENRLNKVYEEIQQ